MRREALSHTLVGEELEGPETGGIPKVSGTAMGQCLQLLQPHRVEAGVEGVVAVRAFLEGGTPALVERLDGVAHRLGSTAQLVGDLLGTPTPGTGQENLAAAEREGVGRAQARLQGIALGVRHGTHV